MTLGFDATNSSSRFRHICFNNAIDADPITGAAFSFERYSSKLSNSRVPTLSSYDKLAPYGYMTYIWGLYGRSHGVALTLFNGEIHQFGPVVNLSMTVPSIAIAYHIFSVPLRTKEKIIRECIGNIRRSCSDISYLLSVLVE